MSFLARKGECGKFTSERITVQLADSQNEPRGDVFAVSDTTFEDFLKAKGGVILSPSGNLDIETRRLMTIQDGFSKVRLRGT